MYETTKNKQQLYLTLGEQISSLWPTDEYLLDTDPATWQLVREIDAWLVEYREDERVSVAQYARNCDRLRTVYETAVKTMTAEQMEGAL